MGQIVSYLPYFLARECVNSVNNPSLQFHILHLRENLHTFFSQYTTFIQFQHFFEPEDYSLSQAHCSLYQFVDFLKIRSVASNVYQCLCHLLFHSRYHVTLSTNMYCDMIVKKIYPTVWGSKLQVPDNHSFTDKKSTCGKFLG
jgi:hypothetical protein